MYILFLYYIIVNPLTEKQKCDAGFFECQPNECITQAWVCDNQAVSLIYIFNSN